MGAKIAADKKTAATAEMLLEHVNRVAAATEEAITAQKNETFVEPEEATMPVPDGARLLNDVADWIAGYVAFPSPVWARICALWVGHAWLIEGFYTTPRLLFVSPEKRSGKTRAQEVVSALCPNPVNAINVSAAYLFRKLEAEEGERIPTIFIDETDALFIGKTENAEAVRAIVNGGYRRGAVVGRVEIKNKDVQPRDFPVFSATCLAGIGNLPDTIEDRAIICHMKRRLATEQIRPYRERLVDKESAKLRDQLEAWSADKIGILEEYGEDDYPTLPPAVHDRVADVWEPLFVVAQLAGGNWPEWLASVAPGIIEEQQSEPQSLGEMLLADIRVVFDTMQVERVQAKELATELNKMDERPWATMGPDGGGVTPAFIAKTLKNFGVRSSHTVNFGGVRARGFMRDDFVDAWTRYVPEQDPKEGKTDD
ncbi:DUF3631 domain-containing protein [Bifidobacterium choerinum]|nr:DUF3631 domain-containing protein [Bifidobacterium choerinum]